MGGITMKRNYNKTCDRLNKILLEDVDNLRDNLNKIIYKEVFQKGGNLYYERELYIVMNCDDESVKKYVLHNPLDVIFKPTEDPIEHPGVTIHLKEIN